MIFVVSHFFIFSSHRGGLWPLCLFRFHYGSDLKLRSSCELHSTVNSHNKRPICLRWDPLYDWSGSSEQLYQEQTQTLNGGNEVKSQSAHKIVLVVYHETGLNGCFAICSLECWCNPGGTFTVGWIRESNYCWIQTRGQGKLSLFTEAESSRLSQIRGMFRHVFMVKSTALLVCDVVCICVVQNLLSFPCFRAGLWTQWLKTCLLAWLQGNIFKCQKLRLLDLSSSKNCIYIDNWALENMHLWD